MTSSRPSLRAGRAAVLALACAALAGCEVPVWRLTLSPEAPPALRLTGEELVLQARAFGPLGVEAAVPRERLHWESSAPEVASVVDGRVTARGPGRAVVSVAHGVARASVTVRVDPPQVVELSERYVQLHGRGDRARLEARVQDGRGRPVEGAPVRWGTSDASVVRVQAGRLVAAGEGLARVWAELPGLGVRSEAEVRVSPSIARIHVSPGTRLQVRRGGALQLEARVLDVRGGHVPGSRVEWFSSDTGVARVGPSVRVRGVREGRVIVTAVSGRLRTGVEVLVVR